MSAFVWSKKRREAAQLCADGYSTNEVSQAVGVDARTIRRWKADSTFSEEVDRLTLIIGVASSAERLRIIKKVVRQQILTDEEGKETVLTKRDLLDWLKLAHDETNKTGTVLNVNLIGFDQALVKIYGSEPRDPDQH